MNLHVQLPMFAETTLAHDPSVDRLIADGAAVAIGVSGGKDSQGAALATVAYLDDVGHVGPRILIHSDLGMVEWKDSLPACRALAERLGLELVVVARKAGGLMERWERRWELSRERYERLSTVTLVPCWSTPEMRFCTSELKTHVIVAELKRRFGKRPIINVTGIRADESAKRAKQPAASMHKDGRIWDWRPILRWSVGDVFAAIAGSGLAPHPAYHQFGMSRVSCRFCIMSNGLDLRSAAAQPEAHDLFRRMVRLEAASTFAFQGARWLGDVAPHLLSHHELRDLREAQRRAAYLAEKRWEKLPPPSEIPFNEFATPFSKAWSAWIIARLLTEPGEAEAGFPLVGALHAKAKVRQGAKFARRWHELGAALEPVKVGSAVCEAWRAEFERRGWPWWPDPGDHPVLFLPIGGVVGLAAFEAAVSAGGAAR